MICFIADSISPDFIYALLDGNADAIQKGGDDTRVSARQETELWQMSKGSPPGVGFFRHDETSAAC